MGAAQPCLREARAVAPRILVADDAELNRHLLKRLLERRGYEVLEAEDGAEALVSVEREAPDLILLDLRMPELSGVEVLRQVRRTLDQASLPIIIVTADADTESAMRCLDAGANDYITKPIIWSILRARLETHLGLHLAQVELKERLQAQPAPRPSKMRPRASRSMYSRVMRPVP